MAECTVHVCWNMKWTMSDIYHIRKTYSNTNSSLNRWTLQKSNFEFPSPVPVPQPTRDVRDARGLTADSSSSMAIWPRAVFDELIVCLITWLTWLARFVCCDSSSRLNSGGKLTFSMVTRLLSATNHSLWSENGASEWPVCILWTYNSASWSRYGDDSGKGRNSKPYWHDRNTDCVIDGLYIDAGNVIMHKASKRANKQRNP